MEYYQYKSEDFASDDFFKAWVLTPDGNSERFWNEFLKEYPEKFYDIAEARILIEKLAKLDDQTDESLRANAIWEKIDHSIADHDDRLTRMSSLRRMISVAAVVILVAGIGRLLYLTKKQEGRREAIVETVITAEDEVVYHNKTAHPQKIILKDSSIVMLDPGSRLNYSETAGKSVREVKLEGSALFSVRRDEQRPFTVTAGETVTTVLGTKFNIHASDGASEVVIQVILGKVAVNSTENIETVILEANQQVTYSRRAGSFTKENSLDKTLIQVDLPESQTIFIFREAPISKIFEAIENEYGVEIIYDEDLTRDCSLTLNLSRESMEEKIEVISKALSIGYTIQNGKFIFERKGCN